MKLTRNYLFKTVELCLFLGFLFLWDELAREAFVEIDLAWDVMFIRHLLELVCVYLCWMGTNSFPT